MANPRWLSSTFGGWAIGLVLGIALVICADSLGLRGSQSPLVLGVGAGVGWVQGRRLVPWNVSRRAWLVATAVGLTAPFLVVDLAQAVARPLPYRLEVYVGLGGALAAILQARVLGGIARRPLPWVPITALGWILAAATVWLNAVLPPLARGTAGAIQYLSVVLLGGLVLGAACVVAWRRVRPDQPLSSGDVSRRGPVTAAP